MSDQLRDRFEAFRTASTALTQPPGVPAIRRTLSRRSATRATGLAVVAVTALVVAFVPGHGKTDFGPAQPLPQPAGPWQVVTPSPSRSPSASAPIPSKHSSTSGTTTSCGRSSKASELLTIDTIDSYSLSSQLLKNCRGIRVNVTRAVYIGLGADSATLDLYGSTTQTLSASSPTATMVAPAVPSGTCYSSLTITVGGSGVPPSVTNLVPDLEARSADVPLLYFQQHDYDLLVWSWTQPIC